MNPDRLLVRVTVAQARRFLEDWANLGDGTVIQQKFQQRFHGYLPGYFEEWELGTPDSTNRFNNFFRNSRIRSTQTMLRKIWRTSDVRTKQWRILLLMQTVLMKSNVGFSSDLAFDEPLPEPLPFEQVIWHLMKLTPRMRYCANPDCRVLPYFIASRKNQKYCNERCALPAQQESKRRWWRKHRAPVETLKARQEKRSKKR